MNRPDSMIHINVNRCHGRTRYFNFTLERIRSLERAFIRLSFCRLYLFIDAELSSSVIVETIQ